MKFLLFNLVVVAALGYLLSDGSFGPAAPGSALDHAQRAAGAIVERGRDLASEPAAESTWETPEPMAAPEVAPVIAADAPIEIEIEPRPIHTVPEVPALAEESFEDPAVAQRRAEVLGEVEIAASGGAVEAPRFMTPGERQRELDALAEDMELLFVDKIGR